MYRVALGVLAGFCIAITMVAEIQTPWAFMLVVCSLVTRTVIVWGIRRIWGASLGTLWQLYQPDQVQFWRHAIAYIKGEHETKDALTCVDCRG